MFASEAQQDRILVVVGYPTGGAGGALAPEDAAQALASVAEARAYSSVIAVSPAYARVAASDLPETVTLLPDDAAFVFAPRLRSAAEDPLNAPMYQLPRRQSPYSDAVEELRATPTRVDYVCVEPRLADNTIALAALVCTETFANRTWAVADGDDSAQLLAAAAARAGLAGAELPDIYFGSPGAKAQIAALAPRDSLALKRLILEGICILRCFLRAGYHVRKNRVGVPGWALQTRGTWHSLLVGMFSIMPGDSDRSLQESAMESSSMRKLLCDATMRVLSNYFYFVFGDAEINYAGLLGAALARDAARGADSDFGRALLFPEREDHADIVAWHSPDVWDAIHAAYAASPRV